MTSPALDSGYSWTRLAVTLLIAATGNVGMWAIIVILPAVQAEFGVDRGDASLPYVMTMVGFALGNLLIGRAVDRFGVAWCLVAAALVIAASFALATVVPAFWMLAGVHLVIGFGTASCFGPLIADISQWFLRRRGIAVAIAASGNYISGAFWPWVLADVLTGQGWRAVYLFLAFVVPVAMLPLALVLRRPVPAEALAASDAASALRRRSSGLSPRRLAVLLGVAGVACCVAMSMPQVHVVAYAVDLGYGAEAGARMLSLMLAGGVVSRLLSGLLADRLGGVVTLLLGSVLQTLALVFYLPWDGLAPLYAVSLLFGLAQGGIVPSYAVIVREYMPAREAGRWVGLVMMMTVVGMALGGWLSGWIYDQTGSYALAFWNGILWNLLNVGLIGSLLLRSRRATGAMAAA